jgi:virginiamycin B lyase
MWQLINNFVWLTYLFCQQIFNHKALKARYTLKKIIRKIAFAFTALILLLPFAEILPASATPIINEYSSSGIYSYPYYITSGSDGALWYVTGGGYIVRMSTSGMIANSYTTPTPSSLNNITTSPNGTIWFEEFSSSVDQIAQISYSGVVTEYPLPAGNQLSGGKIAFTPDGNLWFSALQNGNPAVDMMTPTGIVTVNPLPSNFDEVNDIVYGSDGALWMVGDFNPRLA